LATKSKNYLKFIPIIPNKKQDQGPEPESGLKTRTFVRYQGVSMSVTKLSIKKIKMLKGGGGADVNCSVSNIRGAGKQNVTSQCK
jgi:hypothetical protein